jgi:multimeric flavodoxin WrbA
MRFVTVLGSPKQSGATAGVLRVLENRLSHQGHAITGFSIIDQRIAGCRGCGACQRDQEGWLCAHNDDCQAVFSAMRSADGIIYATPLYAWSFPGQIKLFLDRHFGMVKGYGSPSHRSALAGRRSMLLVTCAGPEEKNADLIKEFFDRFCHYTVMENRGKFVVSQKSNLDAAGIEAAVSRMADSLLQ